MTPSLTLHLQNRIAEVARLVDAVESFGTHAGLSPDLTYRLTLSLDEIVSNVIRHGYSDTNDHVVEVRLSIHDGVVTSVIEDDGHPYDPRESPEPDLSMPVEQRGPGGLGIFLVRQMMDSIDYARRDGRNVLTVTTSKREGDE
jgi:serine/threonine-protein kinase RsbW/sigma-B regulation protein RsbU (phosphoserine phosphatase)